MSPTRSYPVPPNPQRDERADTQLREEKEKEREEEKEEEKEV